MSYYIHQLGERDCAFASLKMLLSDCLKNKHYLFYPQNKINDYYSLQEIIDIAKKEGVILQGYKYKVKDELLNLKRKRALVILKKDKKLHMVYLISINSFYATFLDPSGGKRRMRLKNFYKLFNGEVLEIKQIKKVENKYKSKRIIPLKTEIFISSIQIITYFLFLLGLYFIDHNVSFLIPLFLFLSFILMVVLLDQVMIKTMQKYDFIFFDNIYNSRGKLKKKYHDTMILKQLIFSFPLNIISSVMVLAFTTIILGLNSYLNLIAIGIIFLISILFHFFYIYEEKRSHNDLSALEEEMFKKEDNYEEARETFNYLSNKTYKYVKLLNLKKYLFVFIAIIISLILAAFEDHIYLDFVLFHTFVFYLVGDNFLKILNFKSDLEKLNFYKCLYYYNSSH